MVHRYGIKVAGSDKVVEIEELDGGRLRAVVDGVERVVEARELEAGFWSLIEGKGQVLAQVDGTAPKLSVELTRAGQDPVIVPVEVAPARRAEVEALAVREAAAAHAPVTLRSPIPGRVAKVLVREGDAVSAGQAVAVLEAMKMENELRAPRAGFVREVRCAEGQPVELGQDLVVIA